MNGPILRKLLYKRIALLPTTLRTRSDEYKGKLVSRFRAATWDAFAAGKLKYRCAILVVCVMVWQDGGEQDVPAGRDGGRAPLHGGQHQHGQDPAADPGRVVD